VALVSASATPRGVMKVIELKGKKSYGEWMSRNHDGVKVINVISTKQRASTGVGASGMASRSDKNFTVTYEEKKSSPP
jgi:hypothetical protein